MRVRVDIFGKKLFSANVKATTLEQAKAILISRMKFSIDELSDNDVFDFFKKNIFK